MDIEGVDGPAGVSLVGDEETVRAGLQRRRTHGLRRDVAAPR